LATVSKKVQENKISRQMAPDDLWLTMYSVLLVITRGRRYLVLAMLYRLDIRNFPYSLSFGTLILDDPLRTYGKALRFLKLESSRQPTVKIL